MNGIKIETPASIRYWTPGGKGGFGYRSSSLHRLIERRVDGDFTACGTLITGSNSSVVDGVPKTKLIEKHGLCPKCWPDLAV